MIVHHPLPVRLADGVASADGGRSEDEEGSLVERDTIGSYCALVFVSENVCPHPVDFKASLDNSFLEENDFVQLVEFVNKDQILFFSPGLE